MNATDLPSITDAAIPLYISFLALEIALIHFLGRRGQIELKDALANITLAVTSVFVGVVDAAIFAGTLFVFWDLRVVDLWNDGPTSLGWIWQAIVVVAAMLLVDMYVYWIHRMGHRIRWVWADHLVHHSSQHMNITVGLRVPLTASLTGIYFLIFPLPLLGFSPELVIWCYGLNLVYQVGLHTESIGKLPRWYEAIFMTPSHHRVHHATNPRYLDSNFGGLFVFSDKLFGTFVEEEPDDPCKYGIIKNIATNNIARVASAGWVEMFRDAMKAGLSLKSRLLYLFGPPGWSHQGDHRRTDDIKLDFVRRYPDQAGRAGLPKNGNADQVLARTSRSWTETF